MKMTSCDYRSLPGQNPLFLDFLDHRDSVRPFYGEAPLSLDGFKQRADRLSRGGKVYPRKRLGPILTEFNQRIGAGAATLSNIRRLTEEDSFAVVTGQQLGLFGGPGYSLYKAATAVSLARALEAGGIPSVPVFWLPSDDSDFEEIRSARWMDRHAQAVQATYPSNGLPAERMVGEMPLDQIDECLSPLREAQFPGQWTDSIRQELERCYGAQNDFRTAFASWLASLFADQGLIFFDSRSADYKESVSDVFRIAVERRVEVVDALDRRGQQLRQAGYPVQVHSDAQETLLFGIEGHDRFKLRWSEEGYQAKGSRGLEKDFSHLSSGVIEDPEGLAPNVLLRPILQDHLFPCLAYVGGPGEIAYFAQISAIAPLWDIDPVVAPRAGFTFVDRKTQRLLGQYDLSFSSLLTSTRLEITRRIAEQGGASDILQRFERLEEELAERLDALAELIRREDPPVGDMLQGARQKIAHQIGKVHDRYVRNHERRDSELAHHLDYIYGLLLPDSQLQGRVLNFSQFLFLEGEGLVGRLVDDIDPFDYRHHVVKL